MNLILNQTHNKVTVMKLNYISTPALREYWRIKKLKQLKAKPNCAANSVIKAFLPCQGALFQVDFYSAKPSTFGIHLLVRTGSAARAITCGLRATPFRRGRGSSTIKAYSKTRRDRRGNRERSVCGFRLARFVAH
jgi:hypothetical protein